MKHTLKRTAILLAITAGHVAILLWPKPLAATVQAPRPMAMVTLPAPTPAKAAKPVPQSKRQAPPLPKRVARQQGAPNRPPSLTPRIQAPASYQALASNNDAPNQSPQAEAPRTVDAAPAPAPLQLPTHIGSHLGNPRPVYPPLSVELGESGSVGLRVAVSADGKAQSVDITRSSGFPRLDRSALQAVRSWKFRPAMRGTEAIPYSYTFSVEFDLTKKA